MGRRRRGRRDLFDLSFSSRKLREISWNNSWRENVLFVSYKILEDYRTISNDVEYYRIQFRVCEGKKKKHFFGDKKMFFLIRKNKNGKFPND